MSLPRALLGPGCKDIFITIKQAFCVSKLLGNKTVNEMCKNKPNETICAASCRYKCDFHTVSCFIQKKKDMFSQQLPARLEVTCPAHTAHRNCIMPSQEVLVVVSVFLSKNCSSAFDRKDFFTGFPLLGLHCTSSVSLRCSCEHLLLSQQCDLILALLV